MSAHFERAQLLLAQSRPADAEREAMLALMAQPDDPGALALLALTSVDLKKPAEALASAQKALGLAPDVAYFHYVHAFVLHHADHQDDALAAVEEALRLDPADADTFSLLAAIELSRRRWADSLAAAEQALALDPEQIEAANLRAMALVRLGRRSEAVATIDSALQREPENALSHANQGWNCLHRNEPRPAQEHFREALRLDPDYEYAREGLLEALKARNPIYRGMLAYFLWIGRLSTKLQWAFVLAVLLLSESLHRLTDVHPGFWVLVVGFYLFIYLCWTAQPMFNLLLRLNRFGQFLLSPDQRTASNWFGGVLIAAVACFAYLFFGGGVPAVFGCLALVALSVCVAATFHRVGRNRLILAVASVALAGLGTYGCAALAMGQKETARIVVQYFINGFFIFQIGTMFFRRS